ncbi:hypothetical protein [Alkalihalobacillus deserti]|uniref:hypothetical protein n=1 Tax=Alkalihalobacillus deserti TaxID=2879466 RepID=UPI001D1406A5|nr:hypothetical protein [Alkalihalobacillus deserti]
MKTTVELPKYHELSDAELKQWTPEEFTQKIIDKSTQFAEAFYHVSNWEKVNLDEEEKKQNLVKFCSRIGWREFYLGVHPPSKQIVLLESNPEDIGIRIRLAQQIIDEVKHQRIWGKWAKKYGGSSRIQDYEVEPDVLKQFQLTSDYDDPTKIAINLQLTSEVTLPFLLGYGTLSPEENITAQIMPEDLRKGIRKEVVDDEPRHIAVGRDIMIKYCGEDADKRRALLELHNTRLQNTMILQSNEVNLLGAERTTPFPNI